MTTSASPATLCVALVGNPNTGKSTLFSALAGVRQRVGNYPGVTVEKKIGYLHHQGQRFALVDLPGTYSLAPRSPDEMVAVDVLLGRQPDSPRPDAVLCIVDASNLERNLYLVSQVLEMGLPTLIALNMVDVARDRGLVIDVERLQRQVGVPVIAVQANRRIGLHLLKNALVELADYPQQPRESPFPEPFRAEVARLEAVLGRRVSTSTMSPVPRYLVERILLDTSGYLENHELANGDSLVHEEVAAGRARLKAAGLPVPAVEAMARYDWVGRVLEDVVTRPAQRPVTLSDHIDRILTHRVWGTIFFIAMMVIVFQAVFSWAEGAMRAIDGAVALLADQVAELLPDGALQSLLVNGVISGAGGVIVFLPQILILFFFIGVLEDCGYMARAAYLMDKLMVRVGLSGKSFIPMLSSFACAIPGVMATRVIENRRDRLTTILVAPLMSCSARLPVYTLLILAFIPPQTYLGGWLALRTITMVAMYALGVIVAAVVALVLKRTVLRGPTPPFVMELPSYKWPSMRTVFHRMAERGWAFIRRAGTLIVAVSIVVWAMLYYPHDTETVEGPYRRQQSSIESRLAALDPSDVPQREALEDELAGLSRHIQGAYRRQSILGRMGRAVEPLVRPLGWDWRIGCAVIASFPAREVVVATLGVIYDLGEEVDVDVEEDRTRLQTALAEATWEGTDRKVFNVPVALSIMVFFALCAQCAATLAVIKRETNSWRWPAFTFAYMTALAYLAALITYQAGMYLAT